MLTDTRIRNLKAADKPKKYSDYAGLFLYIPLTGKKYWRMSYRFNQKSKLLSFGEYPIVSLKEARELRDEARKLLAKGIDPSAHRKEEKQLRLERENNTFQTIALDWHEKQTTMNTDAHRRRLKYILETYIFPMIGNLPITAIKPYDILTIARKRETDCSEYAAHQIVQICGKIFRYAISCGKADYNVTTDIRGALRPIPRAHHPCLTEPLKIGQLLLDLDEFPGYFQTRCAFQLLSLTFVRATELRRAEWTEIDFDERLWRIPAERMKMKTPHIVPLSKQSMEILTRLRAVTGDGRYLFPSNRTNSNVISPSTLLNALRFMGYRRDQMCIHGFRGMASTLLNELGYNRDWIERQLAHQERDGVRDAYNYAQYLPQRRQMMQDYADYLDKLRSAALKKKLFS